MIKDINNNNKILGLDAVWQPVNGTKHKFYVYSGKSSSIMQLLTLDALLCTGNVVS